MNRLSSISKCVVLAGLMFASASSAQADFVNGTQGLGENGTPTINAASLAAATSFTFGTINTSTAETGSFTTPGTSGLALTMKSLDLNNPSAFGFTGTAGTFGTFTASGAPVIELSPSSPLVRSFYILGSFTSGSLFGAPTSNTASLTVSFTQTGGAGTAISDSSTLSVPAAPLAGTVPEPASVAMLGLGLAGLAGYTARRRRAR